MKCGQDKERGGRGESNSEVDVCATMREYSAMEYRTHLYFVDYTYQVRSMRHLIYVHMLMYNLPTLHCD